MSREPSSNEALERVGFSARGTVDPRPGRLQQWDPLPRTHARPAAPVPIRCAQARPLDARASTAALAYRPCYLRNCIPSRLGMRRHNLLFQKIRTQPIVYRTRAAAGSGSAFLAIISYGGLEERPVSRSRVCPSIRGRTEVQIPATRKWKKVAQPRHNGLTCQSRKKRSACGKVAIRVFS
jgi:hypothetical protein